MKRQNFDEWFADYLKQEADQVTALLRDTTATRFLIAWSLFETSCFHGFAKIDGISRFAKAKITEEPMLAHELDQHVQFFHNRYQDKRLYKNLMHEQKSDRMENIIGEPSESLNSEDKIFFLALVVYRYRNNIFHGNKGVASWLCYREHIQRCIAIMQLLIPMPAAGTTASPSVALG